MDRRAALSLLGPHSQQLITIIRDAHADYRDEVPVEHQVTLDATVRARYVHNRIGHRTLLAFGSTRPIGIQQMDSLQFLCVDGDPQGIALRWKKGHRYTFKSSNHDSERQDILQNDGELLFGMSPLAHLFVVYTENEENAMSPELERVALTCERQGGVEWQHILWIAEAAPESIRIETGFEQLQLPVRFKVRAKPIQAAIADGEVGPAQTKKAE